MSSRGLAKLSLTAAILTMIVSVAGFVVVLVLNAFFLDDYDAYGEVAIPGTGTVHLPAGEVNASFHTLVIGSPNGGLPIPPLGISINPPDGVPKPTVTESFGSATTINNDAHIRVWHIQVPAEGTYQITTEGQVNGYINPRLAFGHSSSYGYLVWVFVGMFGVGLIWLILATMRLGRTRRQVVTSISTASPYIHTLPPPAPRPAAAYEPTGEGVRLERLKTLAALRDSGALTEAEFEDEKRRILDGG